jgi:hypothetical protein
MPHIVAGTIAATLTAVLLFSARTPFPVPRFIAVALAAILGVSAGGASWNGLLRVNQLAGGPLEPHRYVRNDTCDRLLPLEQGLPPVEYDRAARDYWCTFPREHRHVVLVRHGLGGLYQIDLTEHTAAIRKYLRSRNG